MKDFDPSLPNLELSLGELESLRFSLSNALVSVGEPLAMTGLYPATPESTAVYAFSYPLPKVLVREIFYPNDDAVITLSDNEAIYTAPHHVGISDDEPTFESVAVRTTMQLMNTDVVCEEVLCIEKKDDVCSGYVNVEYSRNGKAISPNMIEFDKNKPFDEAVSDLVRDIEALKIPLTSKDAEKLRQITVFIEGAS